MKMRIMNGAVGIFLMMAMGTAATVAQDNWRVDSNKTADDLLTR